MQPEIPVSNRRCEDRCERLRYQKHMDSLRRMKSSIDNRPPKIPSHMRNNAKRAQLMQERSFEIESENAMLLEKMRRIMDLGTVASNPGQYSSLAERGV